MLEDYIERLKKRLELPLPGKEAHNKMLPLAADRSAIVGVANTTTKQGSVLILLYPKAGEVYFPLMLRPNYNGVHGGQISLPGGKKEKQDKDFIATAVREAEEEIGVRAEDISILGTLTTLYVTASNFSVVPVVGFARSTPSFNPNPYEVEAIIETSMKDLMNDDLVKVKALHVRGYDMEAPYFDIDGQIVWGATAMMLNEFKSILKNSEPL